jgi:lipoprotein-anchoring transpeptidase ErfK/SrfK
MGAGAACALTCAFLAATPASAEVIRLASRPSAAPQSPLEIRTGKRVANRPPGEVRTGLRAGTRAAAAPAAKLPFGNMPKGPMQIFISINQQKLHLYSNGEAVAETLVATGVPQHPTPMGAFSIVQKQLLHHSNIYSGAPMPFMERLTWSGVALHEGVNLGHPASHGCIRMSRDFAVRLYAVSKLGAEVFITDAALAPQEFTDAHLFVHRDPAPPVPVLAAASVTLPAALARDASLAADAAVIDVAHDLKPATGVSTAADTAQDTKPAPDKAGAADSVRDTKPATGFSAAVDIAEYTKASAGISAAADTAQETKPAAHDTSPATDAPAANIEHDTKLAANASTLHDAGDAPPVPAQTVARPVSGAPARVRAATANPDVVPPPSPPVAAVTHMSKLPIAIFISRKTAKIYVRQDFAPVFSAPVTIENADQPLGTFVFTALQYLPDQSSFVWNVVAMPGERPKAKPVGKYAPHVRRDDNVVKEAAAPPPPESPEQALARIQIPQGAIDRISQMIVPGSSLTVSDQGLGDETGEGTNFVVVMH